MVVIAPCHPVATMATVAVEDLLGAPALEARFLVVAVLLAAIATALTIAVDTRIEATVAVACALA